MSSILRLMHKARKITGISNYYDSAGLLPVDSSYDGMLAFSKADNTVYKFVDSGLDAGTVQGWHKADSAYGGGGGGGTGNQITGATTGYNLGVNVQKFPFASSTSGTTIISTPNWVGSQAQYEGANAHSTTHGYYAGGYGYPTPAPVDKISKFPFTSEDNFSDVGDLTGGARTHIGGVSSTTHGYAAGGWPPTTNVIEKYTFASDGNSTDVGDLTGARFQNTGVQSATHGYSYSGSAGAIDKWSFASDGNATPVGALAHAVYATGDNSQSPTHGYRIGGYGPPGESNTIEKTAYASDGDGTDVGDITVARRQSDNASSTDGYIYTTGGRNPSPTNIMERTSYTVDGNSVDVGDLASAASQAGGAHV